MQITVFPSIARRLYVYGNSVDLGTQRIVRGDLVTLELRGSGVRYPLRGYSNAYISRAFGKK